MIVTPQMLWADFNFRQEPLDVRKISSKEFKKDILATHLYFNGLKKNDGVIRIFATLYSANNSHDLIIVFLDVYTRTESFDPSLYLDNGFSVLVVDYSGISDSKRLATIFPQSLAFANAFFYKDAVNETNELENSSWYVWQTIALRSVYLAESLNFKHIFMLGYGHGGEQVYKTACFPFETMSQISFFDSKNANDEPISQIRPIINGGATIFTSGIIEPKDLQFKAALDSSSYAKDAKCPILMQLTSNESGLDEMNDLFSQSLSLSSGGRISIVERTNRTLDNLRINNPLLFFKSIIDEKTIPTTPHILLNGSQNKLYCRLTVDCPDEIMTAALFAAHIQPNSAYRNWRTIEIQKVDNSEYLAAIPIINAEKPVYIFTSVLYSSGISLSSPMSVVIPKLFNISLKPPPISRRIYDTEFGLCEWLDLSASAQSDTLSLQKGAFGLEGIVSKSNNLTTFRLADPQFIGPQTANLQCLVYSKNAQKISFLITSSFNRETYLFETDITPQKGWTKIILKPADFKSSSGNLSGWSDILTFTISSDKELLLNSMLWV